MYGFHFANNKKKLKKKLFKFSLETGNALNNNKQISTRNISGDLVTLGNSEKEREENANTITNSYGKCYDFHEKYQIKRILITFKSKDSSLYIPSYACENCCMEIKKV